MSWQIVAALLCIHYALGISSILRKCTSCDEIAYVTSGYTYWQLHDYRLVPEHPPVIELWGALPLNFMSIKMPSLDQKCWHESNQWQFGWQLFYELGNPLQRMLISGRAMIGLFSVALGLTIYLVSRRWFGPVGGLISLTIYVFSPEMLAHGFQVTTDMAATLFFLLSVLSIWWAMNRITPASVLLSGLAVAAMFNSKFSALLLIPTYGILLVVRLILATPLEISVRRTREVQSRLKRLAAHLGVFASQALIVVGFTWLTHGLKYSAFVQRTPGVDRFMNTNPDPDTQLSDWEYELHRYGKLSPVVRFARDHRLLPEAYLYGFVFAMNMTKGSNAFLNGDRNSGGFRMYFPDAVLLKTTAPALILLLLATGVWAVERRARHRVTPSNGAGSPTLLYRALPLIVFFVVYWVTAIISPFNIGHRHILPIYPAMMIFAGILGTNRPRRFPIRQAAALLLVLHGGVALWSWPHYLSFFNFIGGGSRNGYRHFVDSSVDWGQDLIGLSDWLKEHNPPDSPGSEPVYLSYLGNGSPEYYGIHPRYLPSNAWWQKEQCSAFEPGLYCISATMLQQVYLVPLSHWSSMFELVYQICKPRIDLLQQSQPLPSSMPGEDPGNRIPDAIVLKLRFARLCAFLRQREPLAEIGHSILVYRVTRDELDRALNGSPPPLGPDTPESLWGLADDLAVEKLTTLPEKLYREAIRVDPNDEFSHNNLGITLLRMKKYDEAIEEFRTALRLNPEYPKAHENLALLFDKLGKTDDAIAHYREAIRMHPEWPEGHANLAVLYSRIGDTAGSVEQWREAVQLRPQWPRAQNSLGIALTRIGRYDEAVASFKEAVRLDPNAIAGYCNLGGALLRLGRYDEAARAFQTALKIQPESKIAKEGLRKAQERQQPTTMPR